MNRVVPENDPPGKDDPPGSPGGPISRSAQDAKAAVDFTAHLHSPDETSEHRGWHKPRRIPHFDQAALFQLITYRLADSLPRTRLKELEMELETVDPERIDAERRKRIEQWLDAGHGSCVLEQPAAARCVLDTWNYHDGSRYTLIAWTVMPNHVHVLVKQHRSFRLADMVSSWKKYTARRINQLLVSGQLHPGRADLPIGPSAGPPRPSSFRPFWQRGYWDRFIRSESHYHAAIDYILNNPVKADLVRSPDEWPWSGVKTHPPLDPVPGGG